MADTDPVSIYKSMVDGIDLSEHPGWENEARLTLKKLERIPSGERLHFITIPLSTWSQPINRLKDSAWAAHQPIQSHLGLPVTTPSEAMFARWKRRARELSMRIPAVFCPVPVSMKAIQWIWDHAQMRGIVMKPRTRQMRRSPRRIVQIRGLTCGLCRSLCSMKAVCLILKVLLLVLRRSSAAI